MYRFGFEIEVCHDKNENPIVKHFEKVEESALTPENTDLCGIEFITSTPLYFHHNLICNQNGEDITEEWKLSCEAFKNFAICSTDDPQQYDLHISDDESRPQNYYYRVLMTFHTVQQFVNTYQQKLIDKGVISPEQGLRKSKRYKNTYCYHNELLYLPDFPENVLDKILVTERWKQTWCRYQSLNIVGRTLYGGGKDKRESTAKHDERFNFKKYSPRFEFRHQYFTNSNNMFETFHEMLCTVTEMMTVASNLALNDVLKVNEPELKKIKQIFTAKKKLGLIDEHKDKIEKCVEHTSWKSWKKRTY